MRTTTILLALALLTSAPLLAQEDNSRDKRAPAEQRGKAPSTAGPVADRPKSDIDPAALAEERVKAYQKVLDLTDEQVLKMTRLFLRSEKEALPLRQECANLRARVEEKLEAGATQAETVLTDEQRAQLALMRREGKFDDQATGCGMHHAGVCCGGAGTQARKEVRSNDRGARPAREAAPARGR